MAPHQPAARDTLNAAQQPYQSSDGTLNQLFHQLEPVIAQQMLNFILLQQQTQSHNPNTPHSVAQMPR